MQTAIIYTSKQGFTKEAAETIHSIRSDSTLINIKEKETIDVAAYDKIYLGSPLYYGTVDKKIKQFITTHQDTLLQKELIIFLSGMNPNTIKDSIELNFSTTIQNHATIKHIGGGYRLKKLNFLQRFIVRVLAKVKEDKNRLNTAVIKEIAKQ